MRRSLALKLSSVGVLGTSALLAQAAPNERELAARAAMLSQAERASDLGDHTQALDLFSRAASIRMTPSLRLRLAQEHNALGHTLDAHELAARCATEARADPTATNAAQVSAACDALTADLRTRVGRLTLRVASPPPGLRVRVAGGEVSQALWGVPYTVLPGRVVVEATAEWHQPFHQEVTVPAGQDVDLSVSLTPMARPQGPRSQPSPASGPSLVGPIALAAGGVVALGLAGVFFGLREGNVSERDAQCSRDGCLATSLDLDATARTQTTLVNVFLGVGGAALVGAGVWFFLSRASSARPARAAISGVVAPVQGGAVLGLAGAL